ncbi:AraC family transcriptional regulator [Pendulispora rubella]|uniref:AraC family transcriptional regulator n=1 Tax=Pendulispora rubella TaxID=2741070 RepID=A0ABZ2L5Y9_9BACT
MSAAALLRITEFIHANINQPLEVGTLAGVAAQSRFHFSRVFARSVGVSPHRYVMQLRLQRARDLLRDGRKTLSEIAYATGFVDQSHLTRWSRKIYGVPPGRLRR